MLYCHYHQLLVSPSQYFLSSLGDDLMQIYALLFYGLEMRMEFRAQTPLLIYNMLWSLVIWWRRAQKPHVIYNMQWTMFPC